MEHLDGETTYFRFSLTKYGFIINLWLLKLKEPKNGDQNLKRSGDDGGIKLRSTKEFAITHHFVRVYEPPKIVTYHHVNDNFEKRH